MKTSYLLVVLLVLAVDVFGNPGYPGNRFDDEMDDYSSEDYFGDYDDWDEPESAVSGKLAACMKKLPADKSIDVLLDLSPQTAKVITTNGLTELFGGNSRHPEKMAKLLAWDTAELVDIFSANFSLNQVQVILLNGKTRNYISVDGTSQATPQSPSQPSFNVHLPMMPPMFKMNALAEKTEEALKLYFTGKDPKLSTSRTDGKTTLFTVVITDGLQQTSPSLFPEPSVILDTFGNYANGTPKYTQRNVIIAHPPEVLFDLMETARYMVCQELGGISK